MLMLVRCEVDLHVLESDLHVFENLHSMQLTIEVVRCWFDMICEEGFFSFDSGVTNDQEVGSYQSVPASQKQPLHLLYSTMVRLLMVQLYRL